MKKELMLSTLMLSTTVSAQSFAAIETTINKAAETNLKTFQTPVFHLTNPFTNKSSEVYGVINMTKEGYRLEDLNFGKVTHSVFFKIFNKDGSEYKDFEMVDSDDGGWFMELRGSSPDHKSYVLWSCSSTLNCGFESPGFLHLSLNKQNTKEVHYTVNLPVARYSETGQRQLERIHMHFDAEFHITK